MKPALVIAKDGVGKHAVLFIGDKRQMPTADGIFHDEAALRAAGLVGQVEIQLLRAPMPFRRRVAQVTPGPAALAAHEVEPVIVPEVNLAPEPAPRRRGRPPRNAVA